MDGTTRPITQQENKMSYKIQPPFLPPIHAGPVDPMPHVTIRDYEQRCTWHVPYEGQTTLPMFLDGGYKGETFEHVNKYKLGGLNTENATFTPWLK